MWMDDNPRDILGGTETEIIENNTILNWELAREWGNITFNNNTIKCNLHLFFTNSGGTLMLTTSLFSQVHNRNILVMIVMKTVKIQVRDNILWNTTRGFDIDFTTMS